MDKSRKKRIFIFAGALIVIALLVIVNLSRSGRGGVKIQTDRVVRGSITSSVSGSAKIQPEVQVKISAKVSGQIVRLGVREGDYVRKGDFLVQLDQEYYRAAVAQSRSNLKYAQAGFEKSENEYERAVSLFKDQLISQAELDIAKSTYEQAAAQVDQNRAVLEQAEDNLAKTTIYSPMDGTVSQLNKKAGEMAMGSQFTLDVIMIVADLTQMMAETEIDENDVVSVSLGDTAKVMVDAFPETEFLGIVKEIANTGRSAGLGTQEEVTNFLVKVSMFDPPAGIRPGMSATVDIMTETRHNVLKVPIQCVTVREPLKRSEDSTDVKGPAAGDSMIRVVFVVQDGKAYQREVETGISSDSEWEIVSGVEEGEEVVSGSYRILSKQLKDGDPVEVDNTLKQFGRENL
ncbi:MAG TPA: efflux RND transporter periplasmic adaptor subunit [bacterium]|nr:efflux RND transporter periplasmic adaptor subunit [bacterium]